MKDICAAPGSRTLVGYCQRDGQRPSRSVRRRSLPLGLVTLTAVKELFEALTGASPKVGMRGTAATALPRGTFAIPTTASPPREIAVSTLSCRSRFSEAARQPSLGSTRFGSVKQPFVASSTGHDRTYTPWP